MARVEPFITPAYNAAAYIRLSVEDSKNRGDSIENQKAIITGFIDRNPDIRLRETYIDNGVSGQLFERAAFQKMLSDIEAGEISCVVVKDLSRLGRNTIDTGYYIEKYMPLHNVRFISVNDNFDTDVSDGGIMLPIKNMMNEAIALEISRKVRTQARQSMKDGDFIGSRPPYGYLKDPNNCHRLVIDEAAAAVVRRIFQWADEKVALAEIVRRLNSAGVPSPSFRKHAQGLITHDRLIGHKPWQSWTVYKILDKEVYVGDMVQGKTKSIRRRQSQADPTEWVIVRDTHPAIISREIFERVKAYRNEVSQSFAQRPTKEYSQNLFKGRIFCGHCGGMMNRGRRNGHINVYWYRCIAQNRIGKDACRQVSIKETDLLTAASEVIRAQVDVICGKSLYQFRNDNQARKTSFDTEISSITQRIEKNNRFMRSLYESLINAVISKDEYLVMKADYENRIADDTLKLENLKDKKRGLNDTLIRYGSFADDMEKAAGNGLTAELIEGLIDRINVYEDRHIEIVFKYNDEFIQYAALSADDRS